MELFNLEINNIFLSFIKVIFLTLNLLFLVFLIVVYKQFNSMNTIVHDLQDSPILKSTIITIILITVSLFLTSIVIL